MQVFQVREMVRRWMAESLGGIPYCQGVVLHGSINWLADEDEMPAASDVDLLIIVPTNSPRRRREKRAYHSLTLELSYLPISELQPPQAAAVKHYLAGSFVGDSVLYDPTGYLGWLHSYVAARYFRRCWVVRRCRSVMDKIGEASRFPRDRPLHQQILAWFFRSGLTTHVLLTAGLENPTVRLRFSSARKLLQRTGRLGLHEKLLGLLGADTVNGEAVWGHVQDLRRVFDAAKRRVTSTYEFAADISDHGQLGALSDAERLIQHGQHREAVFWLGVCFARCWCVIDERGTRAEKTMAEQCTLQLLDTLRVDGSEEIREKYEAVEQLLPAVWQNALAIVRQHPSIVD